MISHQSFTFNPFQENTYIVYTESGNCVIIDPGCHDTSEQQELLTFILEKRLKPVAVWLTHAHIDHVLGLEFCCRHFGIRAVISRPEVAQLKAVDVYAPNYGFSSYQGTDQLEIMDQFDPLSIDEEKFRILSVPGHAPGHVAFYHESSSQLWAGDVLFRLSIGRTDLPGGNFALLENSIRMVIYALPPETTVYPGHGPSTTVGYERLHNPFVKFS